MVEWNISAHLNSSSIMMCTVHCSIADWNWPSIVGEDCLDFRPEAIHSSMLHFCFLGKSRLVAWGRGSKWWWLVAHYMPLPGCARRPHQCKSHPRFFHGGGILPIKCAHKAPNGTFSFLAFFAPPFRFHTGWVIAEESPAALYSTFALFPSQGMNNGMYNCCL